MAAVAPVDMSEWKQRDKNFVEGSFEEQLKEALLASKMEFEENKKQSKVVEPTPKPPTKKAGNKKGTTTMSLDQFNQGPQVFPAVMILEHILNKIYIYGRKFPRKW